MSNRKELSREQQERVRAEIAREYVKQGRNKQATGRALKMTGQAVAEPPPKDEHLARHLMIEAARRVGGFVADDFAKLRAIKIDHDPGLSYWLSQLDAIRAARVASMPRAAEPLAAPPRKRKTA